MVLKYRRLDTIEKVKKNGHIFTAQFAPTI